MSGEMKSSRDGGWGWMIVVASFVTMICTRSVSRCVSIFFVEFQMHFSTDYSTTSWIISLLECTTMLCAPLGSYVGNRLSTRVAVMTGGFLSSVGLALSCFAPSLQFLYISVGILTGLGFALSFTPAVAIVGTYFNERKALAYGIAMSGRGIGTFILPPLFQHLINLYSWTGALLILGGLVSNLCVCGSLMRPLVDQSKGEEENVKAILDEPHVQEDSYQEEVNDKEEEHEESSEELILKDTEMMRKLKDSKQDTSSEPTNLKDLSILKDSNLVTQRAESGLGKSVVAELQIADLKVHDSKLINLMLPDMKKMDSKLSESLMLAEPKLVTPKLPQSQTLCVVVSSKCSGLLIKQSRKRTKPKCCLFPQSSGKHSFLFTPDFLMLAVSFLFLAFGCSVPIIYLVPYSLSVDISHHQAVLLMSILGVMGIVGNIAFGWISDRKCVRTFREVTFLIAVGFEGLSCLFMPLLRSFSTLLIFSVVYGFFDGAFMALIPVVTCDIVGSAHLSSALGVVGFLHAIPYLISPPIAGWLLDQSGSYTALFLLSGLSLLCSAFILIALALLRHCCRGRSVSLQDQHKA
ncbi:monocarboxylate transporter 12 [Tachysurus vachellii]|uniref:monocarboxylate transporter 12 n=1 Tax=Tachysurus vachellii TaxID=175792 RepID=UPI00296B20F5|nr:monocarboxylate transporter 12 [Tachysurus vachellii]XP_060735151.1 monocarboxylate transporter 12 [Tachysurus vachellii]XP_060735152.1 monocarboxylate transporter 12 [Tachysurus vachellii]XP_060735153.1 monocarboxylate transporter 12 [Tachysurus vachellii]XP_060735154.1 monocarboxylate transporter 12 [Tachysurus vachellii]XP_060735155.1 monocarboxylate transporter 12 [Tachysurus vachellii]